MNQMADAATKTLQELQLTREEDKDSYKYQEAQ
jgi:hypothetical protein